MDNCYIDSWHDMHNIGRYVMLSASLFLGCLFMYLLSQESQNPRIKTWLSHFITYQTQPKADTTLQRQGYFAQDARHTCTAHAVQDSNSRVFILNSSSTCGAS